MDRRAGRCAGFSAPEALVGLLLGLFLVQLGYGTLQRLRATEGRLAARTDALVAMRVARHVLRTELGRGMEGEDWLATPDSVSLRAFRGTARLCPRAETTDELTVAYEGERRPDPAKDSLVLVDPLGHREVRALVGVTASADACGANPGDDLEVWRLDAAVGPDAVLARLFERGSYHLASSALRYRRGASGRQPLTPEVWSSATGWTLTGDQLGLHAEPRTPDAGRPWEAFLAWTE